ncbi:glycosyltransferase family A protein [Paenibacillus chondroitinus]|uniref:Glycosyltransferase family A protein n=1 Tax=Paenibacillus chondroitinus TaxID=59842 RepID=A0ABU6DAC8_9BACL|nr:MULTISPECIES: glycosyltransferase family A protein [Paenibacillus]MCY9662262.1 glycosyltransferase family 2 protein [Paenibacillus anseongense]MEB4794700.1 glycosyltransferase family A protein [Paenibacillus chondroitinus]
MKNITIAICTRNRIADITKCIESISKQVGLNCEVEVLIVDDGDIQKEQLHLFEVMLSKIKCMKLSYFKKLKGGVWCSRVECVKIAAHEIILYLDDDVELDDPYYISKLLKNYDNDASLAGVGGIAKGLYSSKIANVLGVATFQMSSSLGKLSKSGLAGSIANWNKAKSVFETEFFHGCNMSFKKSSLKDMKPLSWMGNYAVGDDLYMCYYASNYGRLVIDPGLKIIHHESPQSRDKAEKVSKAKVVNHYYFLKMKQAGILNYGALIWTMLYLIVKEIIKKNNDATLGYLKGVKFLLFSKKETL